MDGGNIIRVASQNNLNKLYSLVSENMWPQGGAVSICGELSDICPQLLSLCLFLSLIRNMGRPGRAQVVN